MEKFQNKGSKWLVTSKRWTDVFNTDWNLQVIFITAASNRASYDAPVYILQ